MHFLNLKLSFLAILIAIIPTQAHAQEALLKNNWYVSLKGTQGDTPFALSLIKTDDAAIMGQTCATEDNPPLSFHGELDGLKLNLTARSQGALVGTYRLLPKIEYTSPEIIAQYPTIKESYIAGYFGEYEDNRTSHVENVDVDYRAGYYGTPEKQYIDFHGDALDLEAFARQVISSFLTHDKQWLSQNMNYPARIYINRGETLTVRSPSEFLDNYERIATESLLAKMSTWPTCNFWTNHNGLSLGKGKIWLWPSEGSTDKNPVYGIKDVVSY